MTTCRRCSGLMAQSSYPYSSDGENGLPPVWRCLVCGEIVDAVIMANRQRGQIPEKIKLGRPQKPEPVKHVCAREGCGNLTCNPKYCCKKCAGRSNRNVKNTRWHKPEAYKSISFGMAMEI